MGVFRAGQIWKCSLVNKLHLSAFLHLQTVERTAVPLIKLTTGPVPATNNGGPHTNSFRHGIIRMDISFDVVLSSPADQHAGGTGHQTHRGLATRDFMTRLCTLNPSLPPLVLVLKQFLLERGLLDPYTGGLPSYALTIMVGSLLQPHALEPPDTHPDLGSLLLTFLKQFRCVLLRCDGIMRSPDR